MRHTLNINGKTMSAPIGETLVDAALMGKVLIPHDCASGQCETCRVRVAWGDIDDAGTAYGDTVLACQARIRGDATITFETAPQPETVSGVVKAIIPLCHDVAEVTLRMAQPLNYKPGQYTKLKFNGFPSRDYSYSAKLDGSSQVDEAVFQIKRLSNGRISSALGKSIRPGHKAKLSGPFGSAFLREQETGPLVLASSGTGFAPIWSLARAVCAAQPDREVSVITGVNQPDDVYMLPALHWLADNGQNDIKITARNNATGSLKSGAPDEYLPDLHKNSSVHVAGNPNLVERVRERALLAQASCYADPFTVSTETLGWRDKFRPLKSVPNLLGSR